MTDNVDWTFIQANEDTRTDGYVPLDSAGNPIDRSGVTVATGVDQGQLSQSGLASLGLETDLTNLLTPYLGLRGTMVLNYLAGHPLAFRPTGFPDGR